MCVCVMAKRIESPTTEKSITAKKYLRAKSISIKFLVLVAFMLVENTSDWLLAQPCSFDTLSECQDARPSVPWTNMFVQVENIAYCTNT